MAEPREYDLIVIGGGPAGLTAGLYAARARRRTLLMERGVIGGQIALTERVENYPGFPDGVNGFDLAQAMLTQAQNNDLEVEYSEATAVIPEDPLYRVRTTEGDALAKAVIITSGADPNRLGVPGEEEMTGRGVSYCATCDAAFFRNQEVAVVGGGDSALDEGLFTTRFASKVYIIHRRDQLRASRILQERAFANPKISFILNTLVTEVVGQGQVERLRLRNAQTGEESPLPVAAVFVFIGQKPNTAYLRGLVPMDNGGHLYVNEWMETALPGLYAAGDVRVSSARQVASASGDGCTAAIAADHYISECFRE